MIEVLDDGFAPERAWHADPPTVTAILVCCNGERWLGTTLEALLSLDHVPNQLIVVDVASQDRTRELVARALPDATMVSAPAGTGFGDAVRLGLQSARHSEWIWLLHDDAAPAPDSLAFLLDEATASEDIGMVGPKLREWPSLRRLLEVGVTITGTGQRETGLERGEPDQGQHDRPRDVLAVSTTGALVRTRLWKALEGLDPSLPLFGDDIDFGWRAARYGARVRVSPRSVMFHAEASSQGSRTGSTVTRPGRERRRAALFTLLVNASAAGFAWQWFRLLVGSLLRILGLLVAKAPHLAADEFSALLAVYRRPDRLFKARNQRDRTATVSPKDVRHLLPSRWLPYRHGLDAVLETVVALVHPTVESSGRRAAVEAGPVPDEAVDLVVERNILLRRPWLGTVVVLLVLALVAARGVLGGGLLQGGALLPAPDSTTAWWHLFWERTHAVGIGSSVPAPPYVVALAAPGTLLFAHAGLVVDLVMLGSVPLAALTAHRLGRRLFGSPWVQAWWALTYALVLVGTGAIAQGRLGTVVALAVAPAVVSSALALRTNPTIQQGVRLGLWVALAAAFAPLSYLLAGLPIAALVARRRTLRALAVAFALPWLVLGPWMWQRVLHPGQWWWEAGRPWLDGAVLDPSTWMLALGRAGGPGAAPVWVGVAVGVGAVLALLRSDRRAPVVSAWIVGLLALALAVLGSGSLLQVGAEEGPVWVGLPVAIWFAALVAACAAAADGGLGHLSGRRFGLLQPIAVVVACAAVLTPVLLGAWWVTRTVADPLERGPVTEVPAYLAGRAATDGEATLELSGSRRAGISYDVYRGDGERLGDEAVRPPQAQTADLSALVTEVLTAPSQDTLDGLGAYGIRALYLEAPADPALVTTLEAAPGLSTSGSPEGSRVWTFESDAPPVAAPRSDSRPWVAGFQLLVAVLAIVVALPGRREEAR